MAHKKNKPIKYRTETPSLKSFCESFKIYVYFLSLNNYFKEINYVRLHAGIPDFKKGSLKGIIFPQHNKMLFCVSKLVQIIKYLL